MSDTSTAVPKDAVPLDRTLLQTLFGKLDPNLTKANFDAFLAAAGPDEATAVGNVFTSLRGLLLGESGAVDPADVGSISDRMSAAIDAGAHGTVVGLAGMSVDNLVKLSNSDMGGRYALINAMPFAITGNDALYDPRNRDGSLFKFDPATGDPNLSDTFIHDRAEFLSTRLAAPSGQATLTGTDSWSFEDRNITDAGGNMLRVNAAGTDSAAATHRVTFGDNAPNGENIAGGNTSDDLYGGAGDDTMRGGAGDDYMEGGGGNDYLQGGRGNDTLIGGAGEDELDGGFGNDKLVGGAGADDLTGGAGDDHLDGGDGFDTYNIDAGDGNDTIVDSDGKGAVLLQGQAITGGSVFQDGAWKSTDGKLTFHFAGDATEGGELTIDVDGGQSIKVHDFRNGALGIKLGDGSDTALAQTDANAPSTDGGSGARPIVDPSLLLPPSDGGGGTSDGGAGASDGSSSASADSAIYMQEPVRYSDGAAQASAAAPAIAPLVAAHLGPDYQANSVVPIGSATDRAITQLLEDPASSIPFVTGEQVTYALRTADSRYFTGAAPEDSMFGAAMPLAFSDVAHALLDFHDASTDDAQLGGERPLAVSAVQQAIAGFDATAPEEISARISTDLKPATIGLGTVGLK